MPHMKILLATPLYPPESGGPATYTKLLEERLPSHGIEVRVLPFRIVRHLPKPVRHIAYFSKCLRMARGVDVVYALDTVSVGLPSAFAALMLRKKFMVRVPGDYAWEQARQRFGIIDELDEFQHKSYGVRVGILRAVQRFVVNYAHAVVVPSDYMKKIVSGWANSAKIHRIYTSIALPPAYELPTERPEGFLVLSFGRNVPWKGFDMLRGVVARNPAWTVKIFSELPHKEAMGWLKVADVYVNNSTYEGLSHQLLEALSLGTPVVATRVGGNPEAVGDAGILVPAKDDEALYQALQDIAQNKVAAGERAAWGLTRAKLFSIDTAVDQLAHLLQTI